MLATVRNTSGGNHGHQLKDLLGGLAIIKALGLSYLHTPYSYLDFFGLGEGERQLRWADRFLRYRVVRIRGPRYEGFASYDEMRRFFDPFLREASESTLFSLENAIRVHPCQTIAWHREGLLVRDVFSEVVEEASRKFRAKHRHRESRFGTGLVSVAMHISRGKGYDRVRNPSVFADSRNVRYMFPLVYFTNIYHQLCERLGASRSEFHVFTERLNSEEIVEAFQALPNVTVHVGSNRKEKNFSLVHDIFYNFVSADVLVTCNSAFSAVCSYFRQGKPTIYHPHRHLFDLPEIDYFATDEAGSFDVDRLARSLG